MQLLKIGDLVRVGHAYDGGYVISAALMQQSRALLSFGINDDWSFEEDFCSKTGIACFAFDFSVGHSVFRKRAFTQIRYFFGDIIKRRSFGFERIRHAGRLISTQRSFNRFFHKHHFFQFGIDSSTHDRFKKMDDLLDEYVPIKENVFLKVDIEGFEFQIADDIVRHSQRFHALAMEIHNIHTQEQQYREMMEKIDSKYYTYHIHANNYGGLDRGWGMPNVIEISCIRKDLVPAPVFFENNLHLPLEGIDFPNDPAAPDYSWK